eukprot:gene8379-9235_t
MNNGDLGFGHGSSLLSAFHVPKDLIRNHLRVKQLPPILGSVGWVYVLAYKGPGCTGSADVTGGIITNACLAPNASSPTSYIITCSSLSATVVVYNSVDCNPLTLQGQSTFPFQCIPFTDGYTVQPYCVNDAVVNVGQPTYILSEFSNAPDCSTTEQFEGIRDGACVPTSSTSSVFFQYPNAYSYSGVIDCSGVPVAVTPIGPLDVCVPSSTSTQPNPALQFPYFKLALNNTIAYQG